MLRLQWPKHNFTNSWRPETVCDAPLLSEIPGCRKVNTLVEFNGVQKRGHYIAYMVITQLIWMHHLLLYGKVVLLVEAVR